MFKVVCLVLKISLIGVYTSLLLYILNFVYSTVQSVFLPLWESLPSCLVSWAGFVGIVDGLKIYFSLLFIAIGIKFSGRFLRYLISIC